MAQRLLGLLCAAVVGLFAAGCSKDEEKVRNQYETPLRTMVLALDEGDSNSFLRCFASQIAEEYRSSEEYDEDLAETIRKNFPETLGENFTTTYKITGKEELSGEELAELNSQVGNGSDIKLAYLLDVEMIASSNKETKTCNIKVNVGKIGSNWYICQDPELELDF